MNVWTFSGRVGADAELRTTQSGEKVLSFRVANDIGFGDRKTTQEVSRLTCLEVAVQVDSSRTLDWLDT